MHSAAAVNCTKIRARCLKLVDSSYVLVRLPRSLLRFCIFRVTSAASQHVWQEFPVRLKWSGRIRVDGWTRARTVRMASWCLVFVGSSLRHRYRVSSTSGWQTDSSRGHWKILTTAPWQWSSIFVSGLDVEHHQLAYIGLRADAARRVTC